MPSPYRSLPPLATLRTFEAVSRNRSLTKAAEELALTQSAVSHQIRALENHLGARLFQRLRRGIELSADGRGFLEGARAGLDSILLASERIRNQQRVGVLTVAAPAAFAIWWLVPRLGRFAALHPEIEIRIGTIDGREPDLWRDGIDLAVVKRPARLAARNPAEMPLLREIVFPVCSPSLLDGASSLRSPADLSQHPLIECEAAEAEDIEFGWSTWLDRFGLEGAPGSRRLRFSHFGVALSAAVDGLGGRARPVTYGGCRTRRRQARASLRKARSGEGIRRICAGMARYGRCPGSADRGVSGFRPRRGVRLRTRRRPLRNAGIGKGLAHTSKLDGGTSDAARDDDEFVTILRGDKD